MHSKLKGNIAEAAVIFELTKLGCNIFKEIGDLSKIDLVADFNGKLISFQCKGVTPHKDFIQLHLKKSGPNYQFTYKLGQFDFFAVCNLQNLQVALIHNSILNTHGASLSLRLEKAKNNQEKKVVYWSDYTDIEKIMKNHLLQV